MTTKFKIIIACNENDRYYGIGKTPQEAYESLVEVSTNPNLYDTQFYEATLIAVELTQKPIITIKENQNVS